jgi:hypothetical protein
MLTVPVRDDVSGLSRTSIPTVPLPVPLLPDEMIIQLSLLTAVQPTPPIPPVAHGATTFMFALPPLAENACSVGEIIRSRAVAFVVVELLPRLISGVKELIEAELLNGVPLGTSQLTVALIVAVATVPGASDAYVTLRLLPDPPQTPPPVALQETNEVSGGRMSVSVID